MTIQRRPYYWPEDSLHLLTKADGLFYLQLSDKGILRALAALRASAQEYEKYLALYPQVLCAPLDQLYLFRRASCTLDEELLQDLLFSFGWREANWAAWLAALAPNSQYFEHIQKRRPTLPHGSKICDLALHSCREDKISKGLEAHWSLLVEIRGLIRQLPAIFSPLRRSPAVEVEKIMEAEADSVRSAYRSGGATEARKAIGKHLHYYHCQHLKWARSVESYGAW